MSSVLNLAWQMLCWVVVGLIFIFCLALMLFAIVLTVVITRELYLELKADIKGETYWIEVGEEQEDSELSDEG